MAWECGLCDETHHAAEDCCACGGDGYQEDDDSACACGCPKGQQMADEAAAEFAWMIPHVRRSEAARRRGDFEEAERIKREALREDAEVEAEANMFWEGEFDA